LIKNKLVPYNLKLKAGIKVLDCGCGKGDDTIDFLNLGCKVTSIDNNLESYFNILKRIKNKEIKNFIFHSLDLNNDIINIKQNYDIIICSEVLEHLDEPFQFIWRISNILSKNGQVVITIPTFFSEKIFMFINKNWLNESKHKNIFVKKKFREKISKDLSVNVCRGYYSEWFIYWLLLSLFRIHHNMGMPQAKNKFQLFVIMNANILIKILKSSKFILNTLNHICPKSYLFILSK